MRENSNGNTNEELYQGGHLLYAVAGATAYGYRVRWRTPATHQEHPIGRVYKPSQTARRWRAVTTKGIVLDAYFSRRREAAIALVERWRMGT